MDNLQIVLELDLKKEELIVSSNILESASSHSWLGAPTRNEENLLQYVDEYVLELYNRYLEYLKSKEVSKEEE